MDEQTVELSYARGEDSPPLLTEPIGATLARTTESFPDNLALVDAPTDRTWTYREFRADVLALAAGLLRLGVGKGDRVGLWAPNRPEWVVTQYATAEIGAILVNLNPAYRQNELDYALTQSGTSVVLAAKRYKDSDYKGMLDAARPSAPELREVICFETPAWQELVAQPSNDELSAVAERAATLEPHDPINIQYTSGTTGFPKGATLTHSNISNNGYLVGELLAYTDADRIAIPVPFYHCFGMCDGQFGGHESRCGDGHPVTDVRPRSRVACCRRVSLHQFVRCADHVHRGIGAARPLRARAVRSVEPAHRDHGGLAVPRACDAAGRRPDAHG